MKPTPEQVAEKYETHYDPAGGPHWVTREAATGQYVAYHYIQEAADRLTTKLNALGAAEADSARLDWLQHQLANMDSKARGTWLRIGDKGRVQVHRYPLHAMSVWDDSECVMDSIPDGTNDLREAIDAAR